MANVFTKKNHLPRTTTLSDYSALYHLQQSPAPRRPRVLSPTRRCNPHPTGLVFQKPYNKDMLTFDIWNPDFHRIQRRMPDMTAHLERANFSSGPILPPLSLQGKPPEVTYTINSTSRKSYQIPVIDDAFKPMIKTSRFGHTPYKPAKGIVPNTLPPIYTPEPRE